MLRSIFIGPLGLRSGWRFVLYTTGTLALLFILQMLALAIARAAGLRFGQGWIAGFFIVSEALGLVAAFAAAAVVGRLEGKAVLDYGLPLRGDALARYAEGWLWGAVAPAGIFGLVVAAGGATISGFNVNGTAAVRSGILWLIAMVILGFFEEFAFRGYPMHALARGIGFWPAAMVTSILFGALHYFSKPMEDWIDATTVSLIALFLCLTLRRTGALWFASGLHSAFDFVALIVLGAPNTGNDGKPVGDRLLATHFTGPAWMTGGPRGLEASMFAFVVIATLFAAFALRFHATIAPDHADRSRAVARSGEGVLGG